MIHARLRAAAGNRGAVDVPTSGLLARFTMDSISGSTLLDEQGAYDATLTGTSQAAGVDGDALSFNGSSDAVDSTTSIPIGAAEDDFTVALWVRFSAVGSVQFCFHQGDATRTWIAVYLNSDSTLRFITDDGSTLVGTPGGAALSAGTWCHLVAARVGTVISLYVDGALDQDKAGASINCYDSANGFSLGYRRVPSDMYLDGDLDDVLIYNRGFTASEAADLHALYT